MKRKRKSSRRAPANNPRKVRTPLEYRGVVIFGPNVRGLYEARVDVPGGGERLVADSISLLKRTIDSVLDDEKPTSRPRRNALGKRKAREMLHRGEYSSAKQRRFLGARASGQPVRRAKRNPSPAPGWHVFEVVYYPPGDPGIRRQLKGYIVARSQADADREVFRRAPGDEVGALVAFVPTRKQASIIANAKRISLARSRGRR